MESPDKHRGCLLININLYQVLFYFLKPASRCAAYGTPLRGFTLYRVSADLAYVIGCFFGRFARFQVLQGGLEKLVMYLLYFIGKVEAILGFLVALDFSLLDESGVHLGKLIVLAADGSLQVLFIRLYFPEYSQVIAGVDGFRLSSSPE
jgi:hypothetical protein